MGVTLIGDPGSCHMGNWNRAARLVALGAEAGLDAVKFQLLKPQRRPDPAGNVHLPWSWLERLVRLGERYQIEVFASVFIPAAIGAVWEAGCQSIKFAYSQSSTLWRVGIQDQVKAFRTIYASTDVMHPLPTLPNLKQLYCIPEYPVRWLVDFEELFPRFDGFSSHCLGIRQDVLAVRSGAKILEKHFTLDEPGITCPDHQFALRPTALRRLVREVRACGDNDL